MVRAKRNFPGAGFYPTEKHKKWTKIKGITEKDKLMK